MKTKLILPILMVFIANFTFAQDYRQYFDGADTICNPNMSPSAICISIDDDSTNIWQIGIPQKSIFDSAATYQNALLTDTINFYPPNNSSSFQFTIVPWTNWGILAIQWKQKLDMDEGLDGGKIEFSVDAGATWQNAFNNPHVYNFYGYQTVNEDTLPNGDFVFSGTDSLWRDIWLCYDMTWLSWNDSIIVRFNFTSDSIDNNKAGWMIDNMLAHLTIIHTVSEVKPEKYLNVYPNPTSDIIHIETKKIQDFHIIEQMVLVNSVGKIVDEWKYIPTKFFINAKKYNNGLYYLKVKTNIKSETVPLIINHG
jgi:hypothetical protein